jgi:hypothetical protein
MADKVTNELLTRIKKYEDEIQILISRLHDDKKQQTPAHDKSQTD